MFSIARHSSVTLWSVMSCHYHEDPCGSHAPRQTQQKSNLQRLQTMWLQPPSFSMVARHRGHSCHTTFTQGWITTHTTEPRVTDTVLINSSTTLWTLQCATDTHAAYHRHTQARTPTQFIPLQRDTEWDGKLTKINQKTLTTQWVYETWLCKYSRVRLRYNTRRSTMSFEVRKIIQFTVHTPTHPHTHTHTHTPV